MPRNLRGTLTSSNSKSVHTLIFAIILYKSCTIATLKHLELFLFKNYVRIVAFTTNLQRALVYSKTMFFYYSTTTKLLLLAIFIEECYPSLRASIQC